MNITEKLIPSGTKRRSGIKLDKVMFVVCHDTGNDGSTALQNVNYYINSANEIEASAHYFVDYTGIIRDIPETEKAWHVRRQVGIDKQQFGAAANDAAISVELCFGSKWSKDQNMASYNNYVDLMVDLCKRYSLNPAFQLVGHYALDPSRRTDPLNAFKYIGKTWDTFIKDVQAKMTVAAPAPQVVTVTPTPAPVSDKNAALQQVMDLITKLMKQ